MKRQHEASTHHISGSRRAARLSLWLAALLAWTVGLSTSAAPAQATSPTLYANPMPVKVASAGAVGQTTVHWDTATSGSGKVTVQVVAGPKAGAEKDFDKSNTGAGSKQTSIVEGSVYAFRLYAKQNNTWQQLKAITVFAEVSSPPKQQAAGSQTVSSQPYFHPDLGCAAQCITDVSVDPHGTYATFAVTTDEPAHLMVQVSKSSALGADGMLAAPDSMAVWNASYQTSFTLNVGKSLLGKALEANTTYYYVVRAIDANWKQATTQVASFQTLRRFVKVTFEKIHVIADSEGPMEGPAELAFRFQVNGSKLFYPDKGLVPAVPGTDLYPKKSLSLVNAPESLSIAVAAFEDDEAASDDVSGCLQPDLPPGLKGCAPDKAQGSTIVSLATSGPGEATSGPFEIYATSLTATELEGFLEVTVYGTYEVSFAK